MFTTFPAPIVINTSPFLASCPDRSFQSLQSLGNSKHRILFSLILLRSSQKTCPEYLSHGQRRCLRGSHDRHVSGHLQIQGIMLWYVYKYVAGRYTIFLCADIPLAAVKVALISVG